MDSEFQTKPDGTPFTSVDYTDRHAEVLSNRYDDGIGACKIASFRWIAGPLSGLRVLDLGSGEGTFSRVAMEAGSAVVAMDFAESTVAATARRASVPVVRASAETLPYDDNSFDLVLALDIIEHLYRPDLALDEIRRVLSPAGRLILATDPEGFAIGDLPLRLPSRLRQVLVGTSPVGTGSDPTRYRTPLCTHTHEFPLPELTEFARAHGFVAERLDTYPHRDGYGRWGKIVETVARGPLRRKKWNYVMISLRSVDKSE